MPDLKISQLPAATTPLAGTELVPIVQSGTTDKVTVADLTAGRAVSASALTASSGNLTFSGTAQRITGDMSNATLANRLAFQTSTTNGATAITAFPNGSGTVSLVDITNSSDSANNSYGRFMVTSTEVTLRSLASGTGTVLPITFNTGGSERMRIDTSGNVGIGLNNAGTYGKFGSGGTGYQAAFVQSTDASGAIAILAANSSSEVRIGSASNHPVAFYTNAGERMRIDASGNVGIGATIPGATGIAPFLAIGANNAGIGSASVNNIVVVTNNLERLRISNTGNVVQGTAAVATTATEGFFWITSCAGAPTGAPTAPYTNAAALVCDTTNNRLYVRVGSTWRYATLT